MQYCNCEIEDCKDEWTYGNPFGCIHERELRICSGDLRSLLPNAFAALVPDGYIELHDSMPVTCIERSWDNTIIQRWHWTMTEGAK